MEINTTSKRFIEAYTFLKKYEYFRNNTDLAKQLYKIKEKTTKVKGAKVDSQAISNHASGKNIRILPISVTEENNENIVFVPAKAAAGYPEKYQEPVFIKKLDHFSLPGNKFKSGTFRCFEVTGDSMLPLILPNSWAIGKYLENWNDIKPDPITGPKIYIVVTTEGVKIKKVLNRIKERGQLVLQSENVTYPTESFLVEDIIEVWELITEIRFQFKPTEHSLLLRMAYLEEKIHELEKMK